MKLDKLRKNMFCTVLRQYILCNKKLTGMVPGGQECR